MASPKLRQRIKENDGSRKTT
ncbi:uncharacterized protein G2W53_003316 [Senna tora]|uniref:Uncharacterized protein n=1 Tax=Senna tora TaxID=362788 RepID=A0A834XCZ2_9FABA|nr:uncharacterized protein G2W53_003316 [Senna tora]